MKATSLRRNALRLLRPTVCSLVGSFLVAAIEMRQVQPRIELELVVVGFHVLAELVEGFVVAGLFEVGEFVDDDHLQ